tara:strand:- start:40 stop:468 length:429 start_codon:yes stop_codon:yes gene_type:complete
MKYLLLLLTIASCSKVTTKPLETTIESESIVVAPNPIQGTWYPTSACRVTLKEEIIITDSTFTWVMDKFSTTYYDINTISTVQQDDESHLRFYSYNGSAITFYTRVSHGGEIIPNKGYLENGTDALYTTKTSLIFSNFEYIR